MFTLRILVTNLSVLVFVPHSVNATKLRPCLSSIFLSNGFENNDWVTIERGVCTSLTYTERTSCYKHYKPFTFNNKMEEIHLKATSQQEESQEHLDMYKDITQEDWKFSSSEFLTFPLDSISENYDRRNVPNAVFSVVEPTPLKGQTVLAGISSAALDLIDLLPSVATSSIFRDFASGAWRHPSSTPVAHRYGGYQFGWWAQQLGDGRAHLLGHYTNRRGKWWELQLKGSGKTPYSRYGDGRAVIRSSVREFLAAEAMDALGFRTSRSASLVVGDELAKRDQFYNGNLKMEKTAVVLRLAPTWFRFGSLEILAKRQEVESLKFLVDHIINKHFPTISVTDPDRYLSMFSTVVEETAEMIAQWQSVGFTHGVMNTDNMSIVSVTIDYGPYGFLDTYDPDFVPNSSDEDGMYSYKNQPGVGFNNLQRLGNALDQLLTPDQTPQMKTILDGYDTKFRQVYLTLFSKKLGFKNFKQEDEQLIKNLLNMMKINEADFTMTFWELGNITLQELEAKKLSRKFWALDKIVNDDKFPQFVEKYKSRLQEEELSDDSRRGIMATVNPRYVLRNWIAQQVIEKVEQSSFHDLDLVLRILRNPFHSQDEAEKKGYANAPPCWSQKLRVSCSS
ncbi:protein adenylyltransferase SelO-like [Homarus americanus]|uniref:Selenoprotein O n=1 Tax=Homarus americanus TaxID=6706 RepID=A0A8J5JS28_HOMAM|nr:protein adenylyltransferase SelO-like [Homarus americanus]XP_042236578.1 protein adenylyltransferase SelO-like [Homarus americanus]KAG7160735.1 adenylyltransferase SelO-like [Homarus americanus]